VPCRTRSVTYGPVHNGGDGGKGAGKGGRGEAGYVLCGCMGDVCDGGECSCMLGKLGDDVERPGGDGEPESWPDNDDNDEKNNDGNDQGDDDDNGDDDDDRDHEDDDDDDDDDDDGVWIAEGHIGERELLMMMMMMMMMMMIMRMMMMMMMMMITTAPGDMDRDNVWLAVGCR